MTSKRSTQIYAQAEDVDNCSLQGESFAYTFYNMTLNQVVALTWQHVLKEAITGHAEMERSLD